MSAWWPRKSALGGLPNISFISQKLEPLGMLFCYHSALILILTLLTIIASYRY